MSVFGFGEEDNEKRHKPLKPCGALVDFYLDAKLVLDHHLEVLAISQYQHGVRFRARPIGVPDGANFVGKANAGGVELDTALVELAAVTVELFLVVPRIRSGSEVREFACSKPEQLEQAQVPVVVAVIVEDVLLHAVG